MSSLEFITVLHAVIVGLAIAHLLTGLGRAIHYRASAPLWWVHMCWTLAIFSYITINWNPWFYLPVVVHLALLMGVGAVYSGIRYQQFLAVYVPAFTLGWGVVVRGILAE